MNLHGKRILVVKPSSLGDVIHTLPVVHAIKRCFPTSHTGWIVQETFRAVLDNDPAVNEIIPILIPSTSDPQAPPGVFVSALKATAAAMRRLRRQFKRQPYDVILDLHASFRSGLLALMNPNGTRIGFREAKEFNPLFQHHRLDSDPRKPHAVDRNLVFATFLGCTPIAEDFRVVTGRKQREKVDEFLRIRGVRPDDRLVYANPAARWNTKFWTVEGWARLAELFMERAGTHVVFAGSPQDKAYIDRITAQMNGTPIVAAGKLNLGEAVALLEKSDVYVGVDSGPMHIAAFTGTAVVALFGPTDPAKVGPYGDGHLVITREDVPCLGCRKRSCSDRICLEGISPERVLKETARLLGW